MGLLSSLEAEGGLQQLIHIQNSASKWPRNLQHEEKEKYWSVYAPSFLFPFLIFPFHTLLSSIYMVPILLGNPISIPIQGHTNQAIFL